MKTAVVFLVLIAIVWSGPVPENDDESSIIYWFFSKENPSNGVPVNKESMSSLTDTSFTITRDTYFIVHGWHNTNTSDFITTVREAIVTNLDVNLFVMDWSEIAAQDYITVTNLVQDVGNFLAAFIDDLVATYSLSMSHTTLVGHSLGAHVVGIAGDTLNGSIAIIVGLDPALPLFEASEAEDRLNPSNGQFVQVIHTNGGYKGFLSPIGDADYFPNGGSRQPGCGLDLDGSCSHARVFQYYAESLAGGNFVGISCNNYGEYVLGLCDSGDTSVMGTAGIDISASGSYYLDTNSESPYAKG